MTHGAVVLAGGRSSRMGTPKATLEWHGSTLLRRVTGIVRRAVAGPVVVVRAPGQPLPAVGDDVVVVDDRRDALGPLEGLAVGLSALEDHAGSAFVCAVDLPLLHPAFVRCALRAMGAPGTDAALPVIAGRRQPLAAAYRTGLAAAATALVRERRLSVTSLLDGARVVELDPVALLEDPVLAAHDPLLESATDCDTPARYAELRRRPAPLVSIEVRTTAATISPARGAHAVRAATLAAAVASAGAALDDAALVAIHGEDVPADPELPLVTGDVIVLRPGGQVP